MIAFQIVIPTHDRVDHLVMLLGSVAQLDRPDLLADVFIVENGSCVSQTASEAFRDRLPINYRYFEEGNKSKALNAVLTELNPDLPTIYLDDDVLVPPALLTQYAAAIGEYGPAHYYGGPTSVRYEEPPNPVLIPYMPVSNRGLLLKYEKTTDLGNQSFLGCNWVCYPTVALSVGGFDDFLGPGAKGGARGQETEMQQKLFQKGYTSVYVPGEPVSHWVAASAVQKEWVLDRLEKTNMLRGRQESNPLRKQYWLVKKLYHGLLRDTAWHHECQYRIYRGLVAGATGG